VAVAEVVVLGDDDPVLPICHCRDLTILGGVAVGQIERVDRVVAEVGQFVGKSTRELSVDQKPHAAPSGTLWPPAVIAPNSSAASRSSRSRSS